MQKLFDKVFGGLKMTWPVVIIMAIVLGLWTALMALLVPDGNSFRDIAVTAEWWVLPAILIITNCKKPLEAALKTFVFFLLSQPLVYLVQVPFNELGWGLFQYYPYWLKITLATFPGAFIGWYIKKDAWYSGVILSVMTALLATSGIGFIAELGKNFPNHLITIIYCFSIIPIFIFGIFKNWQPRIVTTICTLIAAIAYILVAKPFGGEPYEVYMNSFIKENDIILVGEPKITSITGTVNCGADPCVEITGKLNETYMFKLRGVKDGNYSFNIEDESGTTYSFAYSFSEEKQSVEVELLRSSI